MEVDFTTDPNATDFQQNVLDVIADTVLGVLTDETTMTVSHLRVVPKLKN